MGVRTLLGLKKPRTFRSAEYWAKRYASSGNSGAGSYGRLAQFKADTINAFVREQHIASVIEFGCGDGNQLGLAEYPAYLGFDVAQPCIERCREMFAADPTKTFKLVDEYSGEQAELTLSLDVIYHLIEDDVYHDYMRHLFDAATRYVIVYSSCQDGATKSSHVRHRQFTDWIGENRVDWWLIEHIPNPYPLRDDPHNETFADFYVFANIAEGPNGSGTLV